MADLGAAAAAPPTVVEAGAQTETEAEVADAEADRTQALVTRSDRRAKADPLKTDTLVAWAPSNAMTRTEDLSDEDPRDHRPGPAGRVRLQPGPVRLPRLAVGARVALERPRRQPVLGAYGIPQALPGSKMASAGADWATNPVTQIRWGLGYIQDRYGSPCGAWGHSQSHGWY